MKISTIIPIYNSEKYIDATLKSLLNQHDVNNEIILVDDGSLDNSGNICDLYAKKFNNIKVYHINNKGVSNARNIGLQKASGDYIHFLDSDDLLPPDFYFNCIQMITRYHCDVVLTNVIVYDTLKNENKRIGALQSEFLHNRFEIGEFLKKLDINDYNWFFDYIWNKLFNRKLLIDNCVSFDTNMSLGEDFYFNCITFENVNSIGINSEIEYKYFIRNGGLVTGFHEKPWTFRIRQHEERKSVFRSFNIYNEKANLINYIDGEIAFGAIRSINNKNCNLTTPEKEVFIEECFDSKLILLTLYYLKSNDKIKDKIFYYLIKYGNKNGFKLILCMDRMFRKIKNY